MLSVVTPYPISTTMPAPRRVPKPQPRTATDLIDDRTTAAVPAVAAAMITSVRAIHPMVPTTGRHSLTLELRGGDVDM
jgi:hypothetical protein